MKPFVWGNLQKLSSREKFSKLPENLSIYCRLRDAFDSELVQIKRDLSLPTRIPPRNNKKYSQKILYAKLLKNSIIIWSIIINLSISDFNLNQIYFISINSTFLCLNYLLSQWNFHVFACNKFFLSSLAVCEESWFQQVFFFNSLKRS